MNKTNTLRIYQFNVGAGDHIVLIFPDSTISIVDFHYATEIGWKSPPVKLLLMALIKENVILENISMCTVSHFDKDHITGSIESLKFFEENNINIENLWLAGDSDRNAFNLLILGKLDLYFEGKESGTIKDEVDINKEEFEFLWGNYDKLCSEMDEFIKKWKYFGKKERFENYIRAFDVLHGSLSSSKLKAYCIAPLNSHIAKYKNINNKAIAHTILFKKRKESKADRNLISSIFFLENEKFRWCFGGDAHKSVWLESLAEMKKKSLWYDTSSDFVKVSHHGSKNSSDTKIWKALSQGKQKIHFGISAGQKHKHPSKKTIKDINSTLTSDIIATSVLSTNMCRYCLEKLNLEQIDLSGWNDSYKKTDQFNKSNFNFRNAINLTRSFAYKGYDCTPDTDEKGLAAFIYDFDLETGEIKVYKGMSKYIKVYEHCAFCDISDSSPL